HHQDKVRILKNVLNFPRREKILHILSNACRDSAPLAKALPDFHAVGRRLLFPQEEVELVYIEPGVFVGVAVQRYTVPNGVLHNEHPQLFELLAQILDVVADQTALHVHIGAVGKDVQRTVDVDLQGGCQNLCRRLCLLAQAIIEVAQDGHGRVFRVNEICLVHHPHTAVNDGLLHRLESLLAADNQLTERENKVRLQGKRVVLLGVVEVQVHGVDVVSAGGSDFY